MPSNSNGRRQIVVVEAPAHPVAQLQGPFEESMYESQSAGADEVDVPLDATARRNLLLDAPTYQRVIAGRWKQKPGERFHPLWKLVAQMSFGIHLLSENMAKSEEDVFQILQTHVDDIDIFLERTTEDLTLAQDDIQERLKCLRLPLQHPEVFDRMLEDRNFRNSIVEGNEKIEHIVNRTGCAMKDALKDVQKGFESTNSLEKYLNSLEGTWVRKSPEHEAVFFAMFGNVEGWRRAFLDLHMQGNKLAGSLRKLVEVVNQMQQKAGEVSRRLIRQQQQQGGSIANTNSFTYHSQSGTNRATARQHPRQQLQSGRRNQHSPLQDAGLMHSRGSSREAQHTEANEAQRSGTGLSMRSTEARTTAPSSRSTSRTETPSGTRDPSRMNFGTPRIVYVQSHTAHHRANSHSASVRGLHPVGNDQRLDSALSNRSEVSQHQLRHQESTISALEQPTPVVVEPKHFVPVELPAEIPPEAFLQAPLSNKNRLSTSLTLLPSERRAQAATASNAFNPATALVELLRNPSRYSKLPVASSAAASPVLPSQTLSALEGKTNSDVDVKDANRRDGLSENGSAVGTENSAGSMPVTPAWASQIVDDAERSRVLAEKIPTRNSSVAANESNSKAKKPQASVSEQSKLKTPSSDPAGISTGPVQNATASVPSELSAGYEDALPQLARQQTEATMMIDTPDVNGKTKKKLSFIAELEGCEPVFLPSTIYTPNTTTPHELEAPESYFSLPIQSNREDSPSGQGADMSKTTNGIGEASIDRGGKTDAQVDQQLQTILEEAIKKSVSDTSDIPIPTVPPSTDDTPLGSIPELPNQTTPKPRPSRSSAEVDQAMASGGLASPASVCTVISEQSPSQSTNLLNDKRATTIHSPIPAEVTNLTASSSSEDQISSQTADEESAKSRPTTIIHSSEPMGDLAKGPVTPSTTVFTAHHGPINSSTAKYGAPDLFSTPKTVPHSESLTKAIEDVKNTLTHTRRISLSAVLSENTGSTSPASAPNTIIRQSPRSSFSANSPASLMSVHSAPVADLKRSNTKDARTQWKAFFSGQLKSPQSPNASIKSARSAKSPSMSMTSSHRHTDSQASQTNASIKTLWLNSPVLPATPTTESPTSWGPSAPPVVVESSEVSRDEKTHLSNIRQRHDSATEVRGSGIGLGLLNTPAEHSPTSPSSVSPVITTATASTAISRRIGASIHGPATGMAPPATSSTFISFPKPRVVEVRRKAIGSGIGTGKTSRSASPASVAATSDSKEGVEGDRDQLKAKAASRSESPMLKVVTKTEMETNIQDPPKVKPVLHIMPADSARANKAKVKTETKSENFVAHPKVAVERRGDRPLWSPPMATKVINTENTRVKILNNEQQPSLALTGTDEEEISIKGHERESSSDSHFDILDAYA